VDDADLVEELSSSIPPKRPKGIRFGLILDPYTSEMPQVTASKNVCAKKSQASKRRLTSEKLS